jgi:hypothetical protein
MQHRAGPAMNDSPRANRPSGRAIPIVAAALFLATLIFYAGNQTITVLSIVCVDGAVAAAWLIAATLLGIAILRGVRCEVAGLLGITTTAATGIGALSLIILALGLCGWINRPVIMGLMLISAAAGAITLWRDAKSRSVLESVAPSGSFAWITLGAMPFLAMAVAGACLLPGLLWRPDDPHPYDVLVYHLQVPREWYEAARMIPLRHNMYSFFPFNAEMHFWAAMYLRGGPWEGMYTAQFMSLGFTLLAALAVYAGAREVAPSENRCGPIFATVLFATIPWVVMISCVAYVESLLLLYGTLAIVWAIRAIQSRERVMQRLIVAGVMAGFAAGTKLTAAPMLLAAIPCAVMISIIASGLRREVISLPLKRAFIGCLLFVIAGTVVLAPWLIRNAIWTGNPLFPVGMNVLGHGHYSQVQVDRFTQAHSAPQALSDIGSRLKMFGSQVLWCWQYGIVIWPVAILGAIQQWRRISTWVSLLVLCAMAITWIFFTHLISRFFVPAIPVAAMLIAPIEWSRLKCVGAAIILVAAGWWWLAPIGLNNRMTTLFTTGAPALGMTDLRPLLPEILEPFAQQQTGQLVMIGDSQAFLHQIPMSRLRYRTVFDVDTTRVDPSNARQVIEAWAGCPLNELPPGSVIYIDPQELLRLSQTYLNIPMLPDSIPGPRDRPFVILPQSIP